MISLARFQHVGPIQSLSLSSTFECLTFGLGASDATYHVMWVIVFDAVDDYGIKELNDITRNQTSDLGPLQIPPHIDDVRAKVFDEALRGASRIAGLVRLPSYSRLVSDIYFLNPSSRLVFWNLTSIWSVFPSD